MLLAGVTRLKKATSFQNFTFDSVGDDPCICLLMPLFSIYLLAKLSVYYLATKKLIVATLKLWGNFCDHAFSQIDFSKKIYKLVISSNIRLRLDERSRKAGCGLLCNRFEIRKAQVNYLGWFVI